MSLPHLIMWTVVLVVAAPASFRNPTAGALALCYLFSEVLMLTGNGMAVEYYIVPDVAVIAVIFAKPDRYPCARYQSGWHQLWCLFGERSWSDRFILLSYPVLWVIYVAAMPELQRYWLLWWIAIAQYFAAGAESLIDHIRSRFVDAALPPNPDFMLVAYPRGAGVG